MRLTAKPLCRLALLAALALAPRAAAAEDGMPDIWLSALEPPMRVARELPANDYLDLFHPDAPWPGVAAHLTGIVFSKRFVLETPEAELASVVAELARRHIGIAMQVLALTPTKECGQGVEGYGPKEDARRQAERLHAAGATLTTILLDGPVWFGHFFPGRAERPACQMPVAQVAHEALAKIAQVRAVFPGVRIGDLEPVGEDIAVHEMNQALVEWFADFTLTGGRRLAFLQAQVAWQKPGWQDALRATAAFAHTQRVAFGVSYGGVFGATSDAAWSEGVRRRYVQVERDLAIAPDLVSFVNNSPRPLHVLPETARDTLTGVLAGYLRFRAEQK